MQKYIERMKGQIYTEICFTERKTFIDFTSISFKYLKIFNS